MKRFRNKTLEKQKYNKIAGNKLSDCLQIHLQVLCVIFLCNVQLAFLTDAKKEKKKETQISELFRQQILRANTPGSDGGG